MPGELIETVGVVAQQVGLDEHLGDRARAIASQPCVLEKRGCENDKLVRAVPSRQDF